MIEDNNVEMMDHNRDSIITLSVIILVYVFAWKFQASLLLNSDVSWLSLAAKRLLSGGGYASDFLETNPPLILYLYTPILFLQHYFHLNEMIALRIYIFIIGGTSLFFCIALLKNIINTGDKVARFIFIATLCGVFFIVPVSDFGQREHLAVLFITPYVLLVAAKLRQQLVSYKLEIVIGIMAGVGFAIKPYFYLPFILIETYYVFSMKSVSALLRRETLIICLIACLYLNAILLFHYDYIADILPLISHSYYLKYNKPIGMILSNQQSIFGYFLVIFYCIRYPYNHYKQLSNVLLLSAVGFWLVFLGQQMGWFYHSLPFYAYGLLLYSLLFSMLLTQKSLMLIEGIITGMFTLSLLIYYYLYMPYISSSVYYHPSMIFTLYGIIFTLLFYVSHQQRNEFKVCIATLLTLIVSIVFYYYLTITTLRQYVFILLNVMLFLNLLLYLPRAKWQYGYLAALGILISIYPFYTATNVLTYSQYYRHLYQHMIDDMHPYSNKKVYFFTAASELVFPLIDYAHLDYQSRFWSMAWLPLMQQPENIHGYEKFYRSNQDEINRYINFVLADFIKHQPTIIFVDRRSYGYFFNIPLDYITLFSKSDTFKTHWRHYHFVKMIDFPPLYKFAVYSNENV